MGPQSVLNLIKELLTDVDTLFGLNIVPDHLLKASYYRKQSWNLIMQSKPVPGYLYVFFAPVPPGVLKDFYPPPSQREKK